MGTLGTGFLGSGTLGNPNATSIDDWSSSRPGMLRRDGRVLWPTVDDLMRFDAGRMLSIDPVGWFQRDGRTMRSDRE